MSKLIKEYFYNRHWEESVYGALKIQWFVHLTPHAVFEKLRRKQKPIIKNKSSIIRYFKDTFYGEIAHLASFVFLFAVSLHALFRDTLLISSAFTVLNIAVNLFPIFLMRYNRIRIAKALGKELKCLIDENFN